jgi:hypothetical protein
MSLPRPWRLRGARSQAHERWMVESPILGHPGARASRLPMHAALSHPVPPHATIG